jgi:hypothetical protein
MKTLKFWLKYLYISYCNINDIPIDFVIKLWEKQQIDLLEKLVDLGYNMNNIPFEYIKWPLDKYGDTVFQILVNGHFDFNRIHSSHIKSALLSKNGLLLKFIATGGFDFNENPSLYLDKLDKDISNLTTLEVMLKFSNISDMIVQKIFDKERWVWKELEILMKVGKVGWDSNMIVHKALEKGNYSVLYEIKHYLNYDFKTIPIEYISKYFYESIYEDKTNKMLLFLLHENGSGYDFNAFIQQAFAERNMKVLEKIASFPEQIPINIFVKVIDEVDENILKFFIDRNNIPVKYIIEALDKRRPSDIKMLNLLGKYHYNFTCDSSYNKIQDSHKFTFYDSILKDYVYDALMFPNKSNIRKLKLLSKIGYKFRFILNQAFRERNLIVLNTLTQLDCNFNDIFKRYVIDLFKVENMELLNFLSSQYYDFNKIYISHLIDLIDLDETMILLHFLKNNSYDFTNISSIYVSKLINNIENEVYMEVLKFLLTNGYDFNEILNEMLDAKRYFYNAYFDSNVPLSYILKELNFHQRANMLKIAECFNNFHEEETFHIYDYMFNETILREVCTYISLAPSTSTK